MKVYGLPGYTSNFWRLRSERPMMGSQTQLGMNDAELEVAAAEERERKRRGFGFNPQPDPPEPEPRLWEGDQA